MLCLGIYNFMLCAFVVVIEKTEAEAELEKKKRELEEETRMQEEETRRQKEQIDEIKKRIAEGAEENEFMVINRSKF